MFQIPVSSMKTKSSSAKPSPAISAKTKRVLKAKRRASAISKAIRRFERDIDGIIQQLEDAEDHVLTLRESLRDILDLIDDIDE